MIRPLMVSLTLVIIFSCNKKDSESTDDGITPENKAKAEQVTQLLESGKFHLTKYYSETPIDYIDTDQVVREETDLWKYVSPWLHDDTYVFNSNGDVTIEQNLLKIPSDSNATLTRHYSVKPDANGVAFQFVGHEYQDLNYRLLEFSDTALKVSASWSGKTVISEFSTLP